MNKKDLIRKSAEKAGYTQKDMGVALDAVLETIVEELAAGGEVNLVGFGKFSVAERSAREGRNPATGENIMIAASKTPKFKAGKAFKDAVKA